MVAEGNPPDCIANDDIQGCHVATGVVIATGDTVMQAKINRLIAVSPIEIDVSPAASC